MTSIQATRASAGGGGGFPPPPLVARPRDNWRAWSKNTVLLLLAGAIVTYLCVLIVAAVYYDVFETIPAVTSRWHALIPDPTLRHAVRDVGEGLLGGLGGVYTVRNRYKRHTPLNWLDRLEIEYLHIPNVKDNKRSSLWWLLGLPFLVLVYAQIGFWTAFGILEVVQHAEHLHLLSSAQRSPSSGSSVLDRATAALESHWPNKLMGYAAAFFAGRRPAKAVFDDLQLWLCEQRVLRDQYLPRGSTWFHRVQHAARRGPLGRRSGRSTAPWYYPPTWKATFNDVQSTGVTEAELHGRAPVLAIRVLMVAALCLVVQGWYVITVIAKG